MALKKSQLYNSLWSSCDELRGGMDASQYKQSDFARQERQSQREMVTGESHYVGGRRYRLDVVEHNGPATMRLRNSPNAIPRLEIVLRYPDAAFRCE